MVFLTLGSITFANFEVPSTINFGGEQSLSDKKLVGGRRSIDAMGRIDDDISWSGIFRGSTATFRARFLDGLRAKGEQQELKWSQFNYNVVIKSFRCSFNAFYEIPYTITVSVIQDLNKPFPVLLPVAYNDAISAAMIEARDLAATIADPSISSAIALLSVTINSIASISNATSSVLATITGPLNSALSTTGNYISNLGGGSLFFAQRNLVTNKIDGNDNADVVSKDFLNLADAYLLEAFLLQIQRNIVLISKGSDGKNIIINGGNLYQLASQYYGDATLWTTIAKANGLVDPFIYPGEAMSLVIPAQTTDTDGVYQS